MFMFVKDVKPRIIKDSRGEKTVEIILKTYEGKFYCSAPAGKSTGIHEVASYNKDGLNKSIELTTEFCEKVKNKNFLIKVVDDLMQLQSMIDRFEKHYGKLGGNVVYALQGVFLKAAAKDNNKQIWEFIFEDVNKGRKPRLPMPVGNCVGGGLHSKFLNRKRPDFQEFLLIPHEETFSKAISKNIRAYEYARSLLKTKSKNDESAWRTDKSNEEVLFILMKVLEKYDVRLGLDVATSSFFENGYYHYKNKKLVRDRLDQIDYMKRIIEKYNLFYIEDPMGEDDFSGFKEILDSMGKRNILIVGDDLTTTNVVRLNKALRGKSINAIIIKPNQIGSILEVKKVVEICKKKHIKMIFSHRSGETKDTLLADLAVGFDADFIKCGILGQERLVKHKRLLDIEKNLHKKN